jgi:hypothetical protein
MMNPARPQWHKADDRGMSRQRQRHMTPHVWKNMTNISNTPQKLGCETNM